MSQQKVPAWI